MAQPVIDEEPPLRTFQGNSWKQKDSGIEIVAAVELVKRPGETRSPLDPDR